MEVLRGRPLWNYSGSTGGIMTTTTNPVSGGGGETPIRPLHEKQAYEVAFTAKDDPLTPGDLYVVLTGWDPGDSGAKLPDPTEDELAPGESCKVPGTIPPFDDARTLRITISVPAGRGAGTLVVKHGAAKEEV